MPEDLDLSSIEDWLRILGVTEIPEWDVLVFLHRHRTALVSADHIFRLLGYPSDAILAALDHLELLGIVSRSRLSQGARMYQFNRPSDACGRALDQLLPFAQTRAGRLALRKRLAAAGDSGPGSKAPGVLPKSAWRGNGRPLRSAGIVLTVRAGTRKSREK